MIFIGIITHIVDIPVEGGGVMLQRSGSRGTVGLELELHRLVICVLDPGSQDDGVVLVAEGAQARGGGVGWVVCQSELSYQLSQEGNEAPWKIWKKT